MQDILRILLQKSGEICEGGKKFPFEQSFLIAESLLLYSPNQMCPKPGFEVYF